MGMLTFSILDRKCRFWAYLVQKYKIVSLRLNLVLRLNRISRIHWLSSLFSVLDWKYLFRDKCSPKN